MKLELTLGSRKGNIATGRIKITGRKEVRSSMDLDFFYLLSLWHKDIVVLDHFLVINFGAKKVFCLSISVINQ